jgi:hypothetical protein
VSYTPGGTALTIIHFLQTKRKEDKMVTRSALVRTAAAVALAGLGLAGCDTMKSMTSSSGGTENFQATMSAAEEVPPNNSTATGHADVTYNRSTSMLSYRVTYSGLTPSAGHIHGPAGPGANAGVVVPFTSVAASPITGEVKITPEQYNQLASGQWYANLHSARNPGGEIRGQLRRR